jgi:hypothetical protein
MQYRCEATSLSGFVQQLACNYLPHGYWFWVSGTIPENKDPSTIDQRIVAKYGIDLSRSARARRKEIGQANLHYLRFERFFLILATHGIHEFHKVEAQFIRNVTRNQPVQFAGYSISVKQGGYLSSEAPGDEPVADGKLRVRVQIARARYLELLAYFREMAVRLSSEELGKELYKIPFEPYAPVRRQMLRILLTVNKTRKAAGLEPLLYSVLRYQRRIVKPFALPIDSNLVA